MMLTSEFFLAGDTVPEREAVKAGGQYMKLLVSIASETYAEYWSSLDLPASLTLVDLEQRGTSFEDLEEEFGLPRGWSSEMSTDVRLNLLKQYSKTDIERLVRKYSV